MTDADGVDRRCEELFLSPQARETDDNLLFVRERLLRSEAERASLLDLYGQVRRGKKVRDDEMNPLVGLLRLSGITRAVNGWLQVRNRIYGRAFDQEWIVTHMPDAELRRQRAAYRRGLLRATAVSLAVVVVTGALALTAVSQARRADRQRHTADEQRRLAQEGQQALRRTLYAAQMNLARQSWEEGNVRRARELLEAQRPEPTQEDLRGFEWGLLWHECQQDARVTLRGPVARGPGAWVTSVAFSPDGRTLASAGNDGTVRLWDVGTARSPAVLSLHAKGARCVAFSPDGRTLAIGEIGRDLRIWDGTTRRERAILHGHADTVISVAFSPDGALLASASDDKTVRLWDATAWRPIAVLQGHTDAVQAVAFSPDGRLLASCGWDRTIRLWDLATGRLAAKLLGHTDAVLAVAFSPDGKTLASGSIDNTIRLWDVAARRRAPAQRVAATLLGHRAWVNAVAFAPNGQVLATGSADNTLRIWDLATRRQTATLLGHRNAVRSIVYSPDGRMLASGGEDGTLKLWDVAPRGDPIVGMGMEQSVTAVAFPSDGKILAVGSSAGTVTLLNVARRERVATLQGPSHPIRRLFFSRDGKTLAAHHGDGSAVVWTLASRRPLATYRGAWDSRRSVALSPDGRLIALGCADGRVRLRDVRARRQMPSLEGQGHGRGYAVWGVAFSPDGSLLVSANSLGGVTLWNVVSRREIGRLKGVARPQDLVLSPDGKMLATDGWTNTKLWDLATRQSIAALPGPGEDGGNVAFSPDSKTLAGRSGNTVRLWNLALRQEVATFQGHTGVVEAMAFSPDGQTLVSGGGDGTVRFWRAIPLREADELREVTARCGDRTVALQWRPVPGAVGYNVYRAPADSPSVRYAMQTTYPVREPAFSDQSAALVNGRAQSYAVAAVYPDARGGTVEGPRVQLSATPQATPSGWMSCSIGEEARSGSMTWNRGAPPRSGGPGEMLLRGSGWNIWDEADGFYYLSRPVTGDTQTTVAMLTRPRATNEWAHAGLMVRESLEAGARYAMLAVFPEHTPQFKWRPKTDWAGEAEDLVPYATLKLPVTLRLTRRGDSVQPEISRDGGRSFQAATLPWRFTPSLAKTVYVGLAITACDAAKVTEAKFRDLEVHPLR